MIDFKKMQMVKNPDRKEIHLNYNEGVQSTAPECQPYSCSAIKTAIESNSGWPMDDPEVNGGVYTGPYFNGGPAGLQLTLPAPVNTLGNFPVGGGWAGIYQYNATKYADFPDLCIEASDLVRVSGLTQNQSSIWLDGARDMAETTDVDFSSTHVRIGTGGGVTLEWVIQALTQTGGNYGIDARCSASVDATNVTLQFQNLSTLQTQQFPVGAFEYNKPYVVTTDLTVKEEDIDGLSSWTSIATFRITDANGLTFTHTFTEVSSGYSGAPAYANPDYPSYIILHRSGEVDSVGTVFGDAHSELVLAVQQNYADYQVPDTCTIATRSSLVYNFEDDNYTWMDASVADPISPEPECQPYSCDALEDFQPDDDTYEWVDVSQLVTGTTVIPSFFGSFISDRRGQPWGSYQALATMNESGDPATPKWCDIEGEAEPLSLKLVDENFGTSSLYTAPPFGGKQWYGLSMGFGFTMRGNASYIQLYWRREDENNTSIVSVDFGMNVAGGYIEIYINGTRLAAGNLLSGDATTWRYGTFYAEVIGNDVYARMSMTGFESISATLTLGPWSPTDWPAKGAAWIYGTDTIDTQYGDFIEGELQTLIDGETYFNRKFPNYAPPSYCSLGVQYQVPCMQYGREVGWATKWDTAFLQGLTWDDFNAGLSPWSASAPRWSDMAYASGDEAFMWLTDNGVYESDVVVATDNSKSYFVERTGIDLDDIVEEWTTNNWKHIRQFYFHIESDLPDGFVAVNPFNITMGWATNLMDTPDWLPASTINLQDTAYDGKVKWDVRSTGRYLGLRMDFDETQKFTMTGGDVDAEQAHGR